jgi:hypothetical protein
VAHADRHDALQPFVLSGGRIEHRVDPEVGACRVDFLPYVIHVGGQEYKVQYLPAESNTGVFGGNSNWRGRSSAK